MTTEKYKNITAPTTVGVVFVSLSTASGGSVAYFIISNPLSYEKVGFLLFFNSFLDIQKKMYIWCIIKLIHQHSDKN